MDLTDKFRHKVQPWVQEHGDEPLGSIKWEFPD
jgi:hypothetical protein